MVVFWNYCHFKKQNTEFTRNWDTFKNSYLVKNDKQKKCHVFGQLYAFIITSCKKKNSKIHLYEKGFLGKMTCSLFFK